MLSAATHQSAGSRHQPDGRVHPGREPITSQTPPSPKRLNRCAGCGFGGLQLFTERARDPEQLWWLGLEISAGGQRCR